MKKLVLACVLFAFAGVASALERPGAAPRPAGAAPGSAPGAAPGSAPGSAPGAAPRPGGAPGSAPAAKAPPAAVKAPPAAAPAAAAPAAAPSMGGWMPRTVTKKDVKGIDAAYALQEQLMQRGDFDAWTALLHFPQYMVTDTAAGVTSANAVDKAMFTEMMKPMMAGMPKDLKMTHKHKVEFITDSIAIGIEDHSMTMNKKKIAWRSSTLWLLDGGKWMAKSMVEGGWGDVKPPAAAPAVAK
ncbi:MAG: hypothetical protein ACYC8T_04220 [Myxococcaceae bacterium]